MPFQSLLTIELDQGKEYLEKKRTIVKDIEPQYSLLEPFQNKTKEYVDPDLARLQTKLNQLLTQYGTVYKSYMTNVNNYIDYPSEYTQQNIQTPDGSKYYVNRFGKARNYSDLAWEHRSSSCDMELRPVKNDDLSNYNLTKASSMGTYEPCNLEGAKCLCSSIKRKSPLSYK